jgi:hypothetical protein
MAVQTVLSEPLSRHIFLLSANLQGKVGHWALVAALTSQNLGVYLAIVADRVSKRAGNFLKTSGN